jgi:tetratricopeptide (TPR) repeat protein
MHEVLRALDPPRRRGAWFAAGGVAVAGAIAAIVLARGAGAAATDDCGAASALRGRWGEPERAALRSGLVATKRPRAAADALTVIERLDDYAKRIGELRVETCRVRTPPDRRAARLGCLDRRTYELGALARALATATPELADTAVDRAHELDDLARCLDTKHTAVAPANAERIEQLTTRLAARHENLAEQVAALDEIAAEARTLGDAETEIQTRLQLGWALRRKDATRAAAEVDRAYQLALEIQDPDWTVRALGRVAVLAAQDKDGAAADAIIRIADAHLERPGVSQFARTRALYDLGLAIHAQNKGGAALARFTAALEGARLEQRRHHEMRVELRIGVSLQGIARPAEAAPHFERAVELARQSFGDGHPEVAYAMMWLSKTRRALGRVAEAIAVGEQSLAILAAALPANHSNVIESRNAVGISYLMAGRHADAVATLETSLAAAPPTDQNPIRDLRAKALEALVDAYVENGQPDKARALADAALAELRGYLTSDHLKIGLAHKAVASVALAQQRLDDAVAAIDLAQPILVKQLGPTDPYAIEMHQLRGRIALLRGDHAGAERHTRTAIALGLDGQRAPRTLVASYNDLALSLVRRGRGREALEPIERLLAILDKVEHRPVERAWGLLLREHARQLGGDPAFSAERAAEQLAIVETARHPEAATERRWLSQIARSGSTRIRR